MQKTDWPAAPVTEGGGGSISWSIRYGSVRSIYWNLKLLDSLREEIAESAKSAPGKEVGGLLFGIYEDSRIDVNLSFAVPCTYRSERYSFPDTDQEALLSSIPEWIRYSRWSLLGYYRTDSRDGVQLDQADIKFADQGLPDPGQIILLVKTDKGQDPVGHLFTRGAGNVFGSPQVTFTLNAQQLTAEKSGLADLSEEPEQIVAPAQYARVLNAITDESNAAKSRARRKGLPQLYWWATAVCTAAVLCFVLVKSTAKMEQGSTRVVRPSTASVRTTGSFGLKAFPESDYIRVQWSPQLALTSSGATGLLVVKDGLFQNAIPLDLLLLKKGTLTYFPLSASVNFEMQVGSIADVAAVTDAPREEPLTRGPKVEIAKTDPLPEKAVEIDDTPAVPVISPPVSQVIETHVSKAPAPTPPSPKAPLAQPVESTQIPAKREFKRNPISHPGPQRVSRPAEIVPPPSLTVASNSTPGILQQLPVPVIVDKTIAPALTASATRTEPQILQRIIPKAPPEVNRLLISPVTIRVKMTVDTAGNVVKAESLSRGGALRTYLSTVSLEAARRWSFRPAQVGNRAVESETVVEFYFKPQGF